MTLQKATLLANKLTKEFRHYYTAVRCKDGWKPSKKYHPVMAK